MYVCMYVCMNECMYVCMNECMYVCMYVYVYVCIYIYIYIHTYIRMMIYHIYIYIYIDIYIYTYIYIYIYIYIYVDISSRVSPRASAPVRTHAPCERGSVLGYSAAGTKWDFQRFGECERPTQAAAVDRPGHVRRPGVCASRQVDLINVLHTATGDRQPFIMETAWSP